MDNEEILKRIKRLEDAVFGKTSTEIQGGLRDILDKLLPLKNNFQSEDIVVFEAVIGNKKYPSSVHLTNFKTLFEEENDEDIAKLCSALASKQRILILKNLVLGRLTSGELSELTGMTGGHLHHHIKDLLNLGFIEKDASFKYYATEFGVNAYVTAASMHRRLSYDNREGFKSALNNNEE